VFLARRLAVATTLSLMTGVSFALLFSGAAARAQGPLGGCEAASEIAVLPSPVAPWKGAPLRVIFAAEKPLAGELSLVGPDGRVAAKSRERMGGPPYSWFAEVPKPAAGKWQIVLTRDNAPAECRTITRDVVVRNDAAPRPRGTDNSVWPVRENWSRATENLYSAWIEKLFDAPLDATLSWPALHEVLRDRSRNVLHNHLGLGEDTMKMFIRPDCADLPYFLRAYFAFKMGLPFGYAKCTRGGAGQPPKCFAWWNIQNLEPLPTSPEDEAAALAPAATPSSTPAPISSPLDLFRQAAPRPAAGAVANAPGGAP
jgi:hypothetical protein